MKLTLFLFLLFANESALAKRTAGSKIKALEDIFYRLPLSDCDVYFNGSKFENKIFCTVKTQTEEGDDCEISFRRFGTKLNSADSSKHFYSYSMTVKGKENRHLVTASSNEDTLLDSDKEFTFRHMWSYSILGSSYDAIRVNFENGKLAIKTKPVGKPSTYCQANLPVSPLQPSVLDSMPTF